MNITEDYCSYEVAKLLKEKGFLKGIDLRITQNLSFYDNIGLHYNLNKWYDSLIQDKINFVVAPTHQMAMKWLREVHQLYISVDVRPIYGKVKDEKGRNTCGLLYWHYMASGEWVNEKYNPNQKAFVVSAKSYEDAVEAALTYCLGKLKLI